MAHISKVISVVFGFSWPRLFLISHGRANRGLVDAESTARWFYSFEQGGRYSVELQVRPHGAIARSFAFNYRKP